MDRTGVVAGIIDAIDEDGPLPPSARALASRLHIAPATLYSSVPSLADAYGQARSDLSVDIVAELVKVRLGKSSAGLASLLSASPNRAVFVTDCAWELPDTPALQEARSGSNISLSTIDELLTVIGGRFTVDSLAANSLSDSDIDAALTAYDQAITSNGEVSLDQRDLEQVVAHGRRLIEETTSGSTTEVQRSSLELVAANEKWSFRALRERTGIAVSRLHRHGSRSDHMVTVVSTLVQAANEWMERNGGSYAAQRYAVLLDTGAPQLMGELEQLRRCDPVQRVTPEQQLELDAAISPDATALMLARLKTGNPRDRIAVEMATLDLEDEPMVAA